jgi:hypothetical protein
MASKKTLLELTIEERELARRIGFDESILQRMKSHNIPHLNQLTVHHVENHFAVEVPASGFTYDTYQRRAELHVRNEREPLSRLGYRIFLSELASSKQLARVAVIRGNDQYDILRMMRTSDVNGDKTNANIIAHLQKWERLHPFNIWGANHDWVLAKFRKIPTDMLAFTQEVIAFAPDVYGQANRKDEEQFARAMRRERGFYLWWD